MMFNPYTGKPRHPSDIASDPEGILLVEDVRNLKPVACGCREGECESKTQGCRMIGEVKRRDPSAM